MLTFNLLLRDEGVEPGATKLVRHQDTRFPNRPTPYSLWMAKDPDFEFYQCLQAKPKFDRAEHVASFVVTPPGETLFVGLYRVGGRKLAEQSRCPIALTVRDHHLYDLSLSDSLSGYRGRLVVEWGEGYRSWVQRADRQDKRIVELRKEISDPPFPGFLDFRVPLSGLASVPLSWRVALASVSGVYLLTHPTTGRLYVGSACGQNGFWGRWQDYVASGHGGNAMLKEMGEADYTVSILEVAASSSSTDDVIRLENRWKEKLGSRAHGLNRN